MFRSPAGAPDKPLKCSEAPRSSGEASEKLFCHSGSRLGLMKSSKAKMRFGCPFEKFKSPTGTPVRLLKSYFAILAAG